MKLKQFRFVGVIALILGLAACHSFAQSLVVDQASGTLGEFVPNGTIVPDNQIAQSFTPSVSAVGFVQFSTDLYANSSSVVLVVNLRQGAYNGPLVSSTDPIVLVNKFTQIGTFYFPANVPVTPDQLYFFELALQSTGQLGVGYKFPSSYAGGDAWVNGVMDTGDYWFREGVVVPEPSVVALFGVGAVALFGCRLVGRKSREQRMS